MKIELIATGDEIVTGAITDANSGELAARLRALGHEVAHIVAVGDDLEAIVSTLLESASKADAAICAGGLGPTSDDLTSEAAAKAAGVNLVLYEDAWQSIKERFARINLPLAPTNKKQAYLPEGSEMLPNPIGTAPGYLTNINGKPFFFAPGVPRELFLMFEEQIAPRLARFAEERASFASRVWRTFGYTESGLGDILKSVENEFPDVRVAYRANFPEIRITVTAKGHDKTEAENILQRPSEIVEEKIGQWTFSRDGRSLPKVIGDLLTKRKMKLAVAESCSGGLIGKMLTDIPGSSDYFAGGVISYSNDLKIKLLGVPEDVIKTHGAVSAECAKAMAEGVRARCGVDVGLAVTGVAGPTGGTPEKPVGTVFMAVSTSQGTEVRGGAWTRGDREQIRLLSAFAALDFVRKILS